MTALEFLAFHESFKSFMPGITPSSILETIGLTDAANKQIRYYSSGMKQRIKLAQAIFSDVPVLFLDEPCTNLDETGYALYQSLIQNYASNKLIIVSSNDKLEYNFCEEVIDIKKYK
jgi:ABC-type multidrug transport system ATPase subunit